MSSGQWADLRVEALVEQRGAPLGRLVQLAPAALQCVQTLLQEHVLRVRSHRLAFGDALAELEQRFAVGPTDKLV